MGNIEDFLFQILLAVIGIVIGLVAALPNENQSRLIKVFLAIGSFLALAIAFFWGGYRYSQIRQQLQFYVSNQLAQSIYVYANEDFHGTVAPGETETFSRLSAEDFPLTVRWEVKKIRSYGDTMEETIRRVDVGRTIIVDNQVGQTMYFRPVISSMLDQQCRISINDATRNEAKAGYINPHSRNVTPGYFIWRDDANVTLYCDGQPMWLGIRKGIDKSHFLSLPEPGDGNFAMTFVPPIASP